MITYRGTSLSCDGPGEAGMRSGPLFGAVFVFLVLRGFGASNVA